MKNTLIALLAFAFTIAVGDHVPWETYWLQSGSSVQIQWDATTGATKYKWENYSPVRKAIMARGETTQTQVSMTVLTGHNVFNVQACGDVNGEEQCSEFATSTDESFAQVDAQAKGWWVFGVIGAPGPIDPIS
jgi:hypothetical protein